MKSLTTLITEARGGFVAIEDNFEGDSWSKPRTTYRVISADTYADLKRGYKIQKSKYGAEKEIPVGYGHSYSVLGTASTREEAESYLPAAQKTVRKTAVNKGKADYIVYLISSGKMNAAGKTSWDWSIWDEAGKEPGELYMLSNSKSDDTYPHSFAFGAKGSLKEGDVICGVDNDTQKKLAGVDSIVVGVCECTYDAFVKYFRSKWTRWCKRPSVNFGKKSDGLPWGSFRQMYSIKGVTE